jgi:hypothetical protein
MTANRQPGCVSGAMPTEAMERIAIDVAKTLSVPVSLLDDYLRTLVAVADTGRRLTQPELDAYREHGMEAAQLGTPLPAMVDAYLTATWMAWDELPAARTVGTVGALHSVTRGVLRAADDAVAMLADGYESARRIAIRHEEALRREFIDDLLDGRGDLELLIERAEHFGLRLTGRHTVAVATADEPINDASPFTRRVDAEVRHRFGGRDLLVATRGGLLVCVVPAGDNGVVGELGALLRRLGALQIGVGRPCAGPTGVRRSREEATEALELAGRLGLEDPVIEAASLLVYRVLLRDRGAIAELVDGVLTPLQLARGGARPLLDTLAAYFEAGGVAVQAARSLHVGVRTVTYRLGRVRTLTGYSATDPAHRFTLEAAVLGARLLDWPATPIERLD